MGAVGSKRDTRGAWGYTVGAAGVLAGLASVWIGGCGGTAFTEATRPSELVGADAAGDVWTIYVLRPDASAAGDAVAATDGPAEAHVCDPAVDPATDPCVLDEANGVFVASPIGIDGGMGPFAVNAGAADGGRIAADGGGLQDGGDAGEGGADGGNAEGGVGGDGSAKNPFLTIGEALGHLGGKSRVYVCTGLYAEQVFVVSNVSIFGGLSCAHGLWGYDGSRATVRAPELQALVVLGPASGPTATATIEDMEFVSRNAQASDGAGSSFAAWIHSATVSLQRVTLIAGSGGSGNPGADGTSNPNYRGVVAPAGNGPPYTPDDYECPCSGGLAAQNKCLIFGESVSGAGGYGCIETSNGLAGIGQSQPAAPTTAGRDGIPWEYPLSDGGVNPQGDPGADGLAGEAGVSAAPQDFGSFTAAGSWSPSAGGSGTPGNPGQGGAGGTDPLYLTCASEALDLGGSSGGLGGCGGAAGVGGGGGGASIALATEEGAVDLRDCSLTAGSGGNGGSGGAGQNGQGGGQGGIAAVAAYSTVSTDGQPGGNGGAGSGGAGGTGGISAGIVYQNTQLTYDNATLMGITLGAPGAGGAGGAAGIHQAGALSTGNDGYPGQPGAPGTSIAVLKAR